MFGLFERTKAYEELPGRAFKDKFQASRNAVLVDVRTAGEFRSGTIKGARNMDVMAPGFLEAFQKLDKSKEYFLFCRSGSRSGQACRMLSRQGYKVYNLNGGIADWPD